MPTGGWCPGFNSLRYLGVLCASAVRFFPGNHRRDAEDAEVAQRMVQTRRHPTRNCRRIAVISERERLEEILIIDLAMGEC